METLDPRLVRVGVQIGDRIKYYEDIAISATGTKYANGNQNECEVKLTNLDKATRNYLLTETSPFNLNRTPKKLIVEAGRVSYGYVKIFEGDIVVSGTPKNPQQSVYAYGTPKQQGGEGEAPKSAESQVSQPPDITITLNALTGNYKKGDIIGRSQPAQSSLRTICQQVAQDCELSLDFQATDIKVANYSYTGPALKQVDKIGQLSKVNAYVDDKTLVVKNYDAPLQSRTRILDLDSGMIGIPEINEIGVKVKFLVDNTTTLGSALEIDSQIYPSVNGRYVIYQLGFEIQNRDTPFYYTALAKRIS